MRLKKISSVSTVIPQAIEHLQHKYQLALSEDALADPWETLTNSEADWVKGEVKRCRVDFEYCAENYFWINQTKSSREEPLRFWPAQQLLWEIIQSFWRKGLPAWIWVHKARQLGLSTVTLALLCWKIIFYKQQVAMIIAQDPGQAAFLFAKVRYTLSRLPWWMTPQVYLLEVKEFMDLSGPGGQGGLQNIVISNGCNKMSSFAQGKPIHILAASELSSWSPSWRARRIVQGDLKAALVAKPGCLAIFESKPNGTRGFWHDTWCYYAEELQRKGRSQFYPMFVPAFFEPTRRKKPHKTYKPSNDKILPTFRSELELRERYALEWHKCAKCGKPVYANCQDNAKCLSCGSLEHEPVMLDDAQLYWYRSQIEGLNPKDRESIKYWKQEFAITAEEGFQAHGSQVFPDDVIEWVRENARPGKWRGYFDENLIFHDNSPAPRGCHACHQDHSFDDHPLEVWELPVEGCEYSIGVDVAYGEGGDYSIISVNRIGRGYEIPDEQVAEYSSNTIPAGDLATPLYILARAYNSCLVAIEAHGIGDTTQDQLKRMGYQNLFQWKHYDTAAGMLSNKLGWWTNYTTKQYLIGSYIQWCKRKTFIPRSLRILHEIPDFVRDFDEEGSGGGAGGASKGSHDDSLMASMICLFTSHDIDFDFDRGRIVVPVPGDRPGSEQGKEEPLWTCVCKCGKSWKAHNPSQSCCPVCKTENGKPVRAERAVKIRDTKKAIISMVEPEPSQEEKSELAEVQDYNLM